jgi:hypothetical protein
MTWFEANREQGTRNRECECKACSSWHSRIWCFIYTNYSRFSVSCSLFFEIDFESIEGSSCIDTDPVIDHSASRYTWSGGTAGERLARLLGRRGPRRRGRRCRRDSACRRCRRWVGGLPVVEQRSLDDDRCHCLGVESPSPSPNHQSADQSAETGSWNRTKNATAERAAPRAAR